MNLGVYNINYNTSRTKRNISLTKFKNNKTKICIMLNVHILDEGIDIPECDSVYLTHPNNNPINIIQRISRANRISKGKKVANILVWSKTQEKLNDIIKRIETYIPVKFSNINNEFINNNAKNDIIRQDDINHNIELKNTQYFNILSIKLLKIMQGFNVTILKDDNNILWTSYNDVLKAIGYIDYKTQHKRYKLNDKYFKFYCEISPKIILNNIQLKNQQPKLKMINEFGLYIVLTKSNKKIAKELSENIYSDIFNLNS
jgi:superfamily II DNA/RNA helicase